VSLREGRLDDFGGDPFDLLRAALNAAARAHERLRHLRDGPFDSLAQWSRDLTHGSGDLFDRSGDVLGHFLYGRHRDRWRPS